MKSKRHLSRISDKLVFARNYFAENRFDKAIPLVDRSIKYITKLLAQGVEANSLILPQYYSAKLMKKFSGIESNFNQSSAEKRNVVQVVILDSTRTQVLLQKRGLFKRQFANCDCVSANAKCKDNETFFESAAKAVKDEVGIVVDTSRFELIGRQNQYENHLTSFNFYAFSDAEEQRLMQYSEEFGHKYKDPYDIVVRYDPTPKCLVVFTINPKTKRDRIKGVVEDIKRRTEIPYIFAFSNTDNNSLLVYELTETEESVVRGLIEQRKKEKMKAQEQIRKGLIEESLRVIDSDEMHFEPWIKVRCDSKTNPDGFALVLTAPYFPNDSVWSSMGFSFPSVIQVSDPIAALPCVSGCKGANTHILGQLSAKSGSFMVPPTSVLTTMVFEELVMGNPEIMASISALDNGTDAEMLKSIRENILAIELPAGLKKQIELEFRRLGSDIAVRSSATSEDMKDHSAAGQANTLLHQTKIEEVYRSIKDVWASLFSDRFISYRNDIGYPHSQARMAVLLQKFIEPQVAGVIYSFDQSTERPGYQISAQPGIGEGVVQGKGTADSWFVGLLCGKGINDGNDILERYIPTKTHRTVINPGGGIRDEGIEMKAPCLDDVKVMALAREAKAVHEHYALNGSAKDIDIEYVIAKQDGIPVEKAQIYLVQARPKKSHAVYRESEKKVYPGSVPIMKERKLILRVKTVDDSKVPPGTICIQLSEFSHIAVSGAVTAILQVVPEKGAKDCLPGRLLVVPHTNNEYNAKFGSLAGVITSDGDQTSHAAQHAYEKKIPCVVGSEGVIELLRPYDGMRVTFDAGKKKVYLGSVPIIEEEHDLDLWLTDKEKIAGFNDEGSRHENFRPWLDSKKKRPAVFVEDFEGHFRRRSNTYGYFQLDYFYKAWDRLTEIMTEKFGKRTKRVLKTQNRQIKVVEEKHQLVHEVKDDDPESIYYYLMSVRDFGIKDLEDLFNDRLNGFKRFGNFVHGLQHIDKNNVEDFVKETLDIFVWMHFGFWLDSVVEEFAHRQLRYINPEGSFHNVLRDESIADMDRIYMVDPLNPAIPKGKVLNLSRERDKEFYALLETVRCEPELQRMFESNLLFSVELRYQLDLGNKFISKQLRHEFENNKVKLSEDASVSIEEKDIRWRISDKEEEREYYVRKEAGKLDIYKVKSPTVICTALQERFPQVFDVIGGWSMKYKLTLEDLDVFSDTHEYIADIRNRLKENSTMKERMLSDIYQDYLREYGNRKWTASEIRERDENLYLLCRGYVRSLIASKKQIPLTDVDGKQIDKRFPDAIDRLNAINESEMPLRKSAKWMLNKYPNLKAILRVSRMQFPLREDAHHLIVPHQRTIARMMIESAKPFVPEVLSKPEDVFDISTDEFVALFKDPDPGFISQTLKRWPMLLKAEQELRRCWSVTKKDFAGVTDDFKKIEKLWAHLSSEKMDLINQYGSLQDKCISLTCSDQMELDPEFEPDKEKIFTALKRPLDNLDSGIRAFEACINEAVQILEFQYKAATLPRVKASYKAEQARLKHRMENLKQKAINRDRIKEE